MGIQFPYSYWKLIKDICTGFERPRSGATDWHTCKWRRSVGLHELREISWLAEQLSAFKEQLVSKRLDNNVKVYHRNVARRHTTRTQNFSSTAARSVLKHERNCCTCFLCSTLKPFMFFFFFSFGVLQLMLPEAPQLYGLLYYPRIRLYNFPHQFCTATPLSRESWSCKPVI
jgi:hypothetical protein